MMNERPLDAKRSVLSHDDHNGGTKSWTAWTFDHLQPTTRRRASLQPDSQQDGSDGPAGTKASSTPPSQPLIPNTSKIPSPTQPTRSQQHAPQASQRKDSGIDGVSWRNADSFAGQPTYKPPAKREDFKWRAQGQQPRPQDAEDFLSSNRHWRNATSRLAGQHTDKALADAEIRINNLDADLRREQKEHSRRRMRCQELDDENSTLKENLQALQQKFDNCQRELQEAKSLSDTHSGALSQAELRINNLDADLRREQKEHGRRRARCYDLEHENTRLKENLQALHHELDNNQRELQETKSKALSEAKPANSHFPEGPPDSRHGQSPSGHRTPDPSAYPKQKLVSSEEAKRQASDSSGSSDLETMGPSTQINPSEIPWPPDLTQQARSQLQQQLQAAEQKDSRFANKLWKGATSFLSGQPKDKALANAEMRINYLQEDLRREQNEHGRRRAKDRDLEHENARLSKNPSTLQCTQITGDRALANAQLLVIGLKSELEKERKECSCRRDRCQELEDENARLKENLRSLRSRQSTGERALENAEVRISGLESELEREKKESSCRKDRCLELEHKVICLNEGLQASQCKQAGALADAEIRINNLEVDVRREQEEISLRTMRCQELEQKNSRLEEDLQALHDELEINQQELYQANSLFGIGGKRLMGIHFFLMKADDLSTSEVLEKLATLNEEIFQAAALFAKGICHEKDQNIAMGTVQEYHQQIRLAVGDETTQLLLEEGKLHKADSKVPPQIGQSIISSYLVYFCHSKLNCWSPSEPEISNFLSHIHDQMNQREREALTYCHIKPSTVEWKVDLYNELDALLAIASWGTPDSEVKLDFDSKIDLVFKALKDLMVAIDEKVPFPDLQPFIPKADGHFEKWMEDAYEDVHNVRTDVDDNEIVAGTTAIGLRQVKAGPEERYECIIPPKVLLRSTLKRLSLP